MLSQKFVKSNIIADPNFETIFSDSTEREDNRHILFAARSNSGIKSHLGTHYDSPLQLCRIPPSCQSKCFENRVAKNDMWNVPSSGSIFNFWRFTIGH